MKLIDPIVAFHSQLQQIRRDIHAHPELCYQEQRTADVVAEKLTEWDIPVIRGMGITGVVGIIKRGTSSNAIGLRADMDALPMQEFNTFPHASTNAGKMHACGHDGHTAMLLGAALGLPAVLELVLAQGQGARMVRLRSGSGRTAVSSFRDCRWR